MTDDPTKALKPEDSLLPTHAKPFFSGNVMPGRAYRHTFLIPGRYRYFCLTHEVDKMIGEILVELPGGPPPAHPGILGREAAPYAPAISINIPTPAAAPTQKPAYHRSLGGSSNASASLTGTMTRIAARPLARILEKGTSLY